MPERPNILILVTDRHRADCSGAFGHPQISTPATDRLAEEGMHFTQACTNAPLCMPARATFISGLYPHNHGMWDNNSELPADDESLFRHLQECGYHTASIGKSHYYSSIVNPDPFFPNLNSGTENHKKVREPYMHRKGIETVHETGGPSSSTKIQSYLTDFWEEKGVYKGYLEDYKPRRASRQRIVRPSVHSVEDYADSYVGRTAVEFISNYNDSKPLCLFVGFGGPHPPWDAPDEYADMYDPAQTPDTIPAPELHDSLPEYAKQKEDFQSDENLTPELISRMQANYYGKITLIDHWFSNILEAFEKRGWLEDLFALFWADHGEMLGDHGRIGVATFHESCVRIPFFVRWPGRIPAGIRSEALAETIDIFPTILEAAGAPPSKRSPGCSLFPVFNNPGAEHRESQLSEVSNDGRNIMIRTKQHKYVIDQEGRGYFLIDLENDPQEQNNLIGQPGTEKLEQDMRNLLFVRLIETQYVL